MNFLFNKEKIDEFTRIYTIFGMKFKKIKKKTPIEKITKAKIDDAAIAAKCLKNLSKKENSVVTMILGHSHARVGFIEDEKSINFGIDSQDLYYSYKLLEKYQNILPNLKNVVLFFALFSPGNDLENSPQAYRCAYYDLFFDIPYKNKFLAWNKGVLKLTQNFYNLKPKFKQRFEKKLTEPVFNIINVDGRDAEPSPLEHKWISRWIDLNKRNSQIHFVEKIAQLCKNKNFNLTIVLSPYNPRIKQYLPDKKDCYESLFKITEKYDFINILDEYSTNNFIKEDFCDIEHLNLNGAEKMTSKINILLKTGVCNYSLF